MSRIFIINDTTFPIVDANGVQLDEKSIKLMIWAYNLMMSRLANYWEIIPPHIVYYTGKWQPQPDDWVFKLIDDNTKIPDKKENVVDGYISVKPIIDNGGFILSDKSISDSLNNEVHIHGSQQITIANVLFQELAEAIIDDTINSWWISNKPLYLDDLITKIPPTFDNGNTFCCSEICNPVQQNLVVIKCGDIDVALSDFILPAWKNPDNTTGPFNYTNTLKRPFSVDIGGYVVTLDSDGNNKYIFSETIPEWIKVYKSNSYRSTKRKSINTEEKIEKGIKEIKEFEEEIKEFEKEIKEIKQFEKEIKEIERTNSTELNIKNSKIRRTKSAKPKTKKVEEINDEKSIKTKSKKNKSFHFKI